MRQKLLGSFIITLFLAETMFIFPTANFTEIQEEEESVVPEHEFLPDDMNKLLSNPPRAFTANYGQLENEEIRFYTQDGSVWFTDDGVWFELKEYNENRGQEQQTPTLSHTPTHTQKYKRVILKQEFVSANRIIPIGKERLSWNSNFFYGNDSSKWVTEVPNYREIFYKNIYDGIDLRYYLNQNGLKYDYIVHPGFAVEQIRIKYHGIEELAIDGLSNLIIKTPIENLIDGGLFIYQNNNSLEHINGEFRIYNNFEYGFKLLSEYNKDINLIIDPHIALKYSTFMGASRFDEGSRIAVDDLGNAIGTGWTNSSDFPNTTGTYDTSYNGAGSTGGGDGVIYKLSSNGSTLIYSTFFGGTDYDYGAGIILDSNGSAVITGMTGSADFPTTSGAYDRSFNSLILNGGNCYVLKLSQNGSALNFSTFIGGSQFDWGDDIDIDSSGNIIVGGFTTSLDFPNTTNALDNYFNGTGDGFILKINHNGSKLIYSTYIGGSGHEYIRAIEIDNAGRVFAVGETNSIDFPVTQGAFDTLFNGGFWDGYVLKLNSNGSQLIYSTFIGGSSGLDAVSDIAFDKDGFAYVIGGTLSHDFPNTTGAYDTSFNGVADVFVMKLDQLGSTPIYSTFIGGNEYDKSGGIDVDMNGNVIITGFTNSTDFPITKDAYQKDCKGLFDVFFSRLNANGSELLYSTFFGGQDREDGFYFACDIEDNIYMTGTTNSFDFPTTLGAFDTNYNGNTDVFMLKFSIPPFVNITSISLLKNNETTNITYSKLCPYTFRIRIIDIPGLKELRMVRLSLDSTGRNIQLLWDRITEKFSKINDPNNFIILESNSNVYNNSLKEWVIDFNITFNWTYPDEEFHNVQAYAQNSILAPIWYNVSDLYRVENDLCFFGTLRVSDEENNSILNNDLVCGGEKLNWSGLKVVYENTTDIYPPDNEFNITLWDDDGYSWVDSPMAGENFTMKTTTPLTTNSNGKTYLINLSGIPPECDKTNESFSIRIDGDTLTFSNPKPDEKVWNRLSEVRTGITITDTGGGAVNGSSVMYCLSNDNGTIWGDWEEVKNLGSKKKMDVEQFINYEDGNDNLIKWCASDSVGNGPTESDAYRIFVDTDSVIFSKPIPDETEESTFEKVRVGITISDNTSGVNASTIQYSISMDSGKTWSYWKRVLGYRSDQEINISLNLTFPNGTTNRIKWRVYDIAGNGPAESEAYVVKVNTLLQELLPQVDLREPRNNSIISTTSVKLVWRLVDQNFKGVTYDIYFNTFPSNIPNITNSLFTTFEFDNLVNGETYYWTVIPRMGDMIGFCRSGIWSFTVNTSVPVPSVTLVRPENGSILRSPRPTFVWAVEYEGSEIITFDIYLSPGKSPEPKITDYDESYYSSETLLEDNTTYYWRIVPWAGNIQGPDSETWSFTIKKDYLPQLQISLEVDPSMIVLAPGNTTQVKAIVTNLGEITDSITVRLEVPPERGVSGLVTEPDTKDISLKDFAEFNIIISTTPNTQAGEVNLTVLATSGKAVEYGLTVEERTEIKVIIHIEEDEVPGQSKSSSESPYWMIVLIVIIVIVILTLLFFILKRQKKDQEEVEVEQPLEDIVSIESETSPKPEIEAISIPPYGTGEQLPKETTIEETDTMALETETSLQPLQSAKQMLIQEPPPTPTKLPDAQEISQATQVPQLPPVQLEMPEDDAGVAPEPEVSVESKVKTAEDQVLEQDDKG
ncbi:DUF7948 domain-containing protein [[Eubacterium] cellulosolvens]